MTGRIHFLDILFIAGITQGLFFTFLLFKNRKNRYANRFLAFLGIVASLLIGTPLMSQTSLFRDLPLFLLFLICSPLAIAPLIFLYAKFLISPGLRFKPKDAAHFLPFLSWLLFLSVNYLAFPGAVFEFLKAHPVYPTVIMWSNIAQSITYHVVILIMLRRYSKAIKNAFSSIEKIRLQWLKTMMILGIIFGFLMLFAMSAGTVLGFNAFDAGLWIVAAMVVMLFIISYLAVRQPEIFQTAAAADDLRKKYRTSGLSREKAGELKRKLPELMEKEKPFLNSLLTINDLARKMSVPPWYVSQVINEGFHQNYFDFVNRYRVAEARKSLADPAKSRLSILAIALESGFNSKSTFNTAFKKVLKTTPSRFRRETLKNSV